MPGVRKSGIPEFVEIPAPTHRTICLGLWVLMYLPYQLIKGEGGYSAMPSRSDVVRILVMSSSWDREKFTPIKEDFWGVMQL